MNLEIQGHTITLGPKALAFIETNMRGMGEVYCRDQLTLWLAGGKCDPDVTVEGPARFVQRGNEIGLPMTQKAGAAICEEPSRMSQAEPMAAAPADSEWPKFKHYKKAMLDGSDTLAVMLSETDGGVLYRRGGKITQGFTWASRTHGNEIKLPEALAFLRANGHAKVADELERSTTQAQEFQVWRQEDGSLNIATETLFGSMVLASRINGQWRKEPTDGPDEYVCATRLTGPKADAAIKEAREQGVL